MPYRIAYTSEADADLRSLRRRDESEVRGLVPRYLSDEPANPSNKRRPLAPNPLDADWELRLGDLRVLYAIEEADQRVRVLRVGRKQGNRLYLRGLPVEMRQP